jgi:hypothetical protein
VYTGSIPVLASNPRAILREALRSASETQLV